MMKFGCVCVYSLLYVLIYFFFNLAVLGLSFGTQDLHCHVQDLSCGMQDLVS